MKDSSISAFQDNSKNNASDELRLKEGLESEMSLTEKVSALVHILLNSKELFSALIKLKYLCNNKNLNLGKGVYSNYLLSGARLPIQPLSVDMSAGRFIEFDSGNPEIDKYLFANAPVLKMLNDNGLEFDANPEVRKLLFKISEYLIKSVSIGSESELNLKNALAKSRQEGKKLVILANHISHLDTPVLDYILSEKLDLGGLTPRFVCGAYMYYNRGVRPFTIGFNTLFVYGPRDFKTLISRVPSSSRNLIKVMNESVLHEVKDNMDTEATVLYPYAGRAKKGEDINYSYGCKNEIIKGMYPMLSLEDCIYLPFGFNGTNDMFGPGGEGGGGNALRNFKTATPTNVKIVIGEAFSGGDKDLSEINESMINVSKTAYYTNSNK